MAVKVVAIGASAGGFGAVRELLSVLPEDFGAPIVVAIHSGPDGDLARSLDIARSSGPVIREAQDGDRLEPGHVYALPAAKHGFFVGDELRLSDTVRDSGFRPSIDALFMTLAAVYRDAAVAVVLSGTMDDGKRGAQVIHDLGGITLVQDPGDASFAEMPRAVIRADHPYQILPAKALGELLIELVHGEPTG